MKRRHGRPFPAQLFATAFAAYTGAPAGTCPGTPSPCMHQAPVRLAAGWRFRADRPGAAVLDWVLDPGSLTARLASRAGGDFRVRLTRLAWACPTGDECKALGMPRGERALVREVVLQGRGQPWVLARSVIPRQTLAGRNRRLRWLGERPLGAFLFRDPTLRRRSVRLVRLNAAKPSGFASADTGSIWGRRSTFLLRGRPLLVAEYFLPALLESVP